MCREPTYARHPVQCEASGYQFEPVVSLNPGGFGECLSRAENFVEIDRDVVDVFGISVLRIHMAGATTSGR